MVCLAGCALPHTPGGAPDTGDGADAWQHARRDAGPTPEVLVDRAPQVPCRFGVDAPIEEVEWRYTGRAAAAAFVGDDLWVLDAYESCAWGCVRHTRLLALDHALEARREVHVSDDWIPRAAVWSGARFDAVTADDAPVLAASHLAIELDGAVRVTPDRACRALIAHEGAAWCVRSDADRVERLGSMEAFPLPERSLGNVALGHGALGVVAGSHADARFATVDRTGTVTAAPSLLGDPGYAVMAAAVGPTAAGFVVLWAMTNPDDWRSVEGADQLFAPVLVHLRFFDPGASPTGEAILLDEVLVAQRSLPVWVDVAGGIDVIATWSQIGPQLDRPARSGGYTRLRAVAPDGRLGDQLEFAGLGHGWTVRSGPRVAVTFTTSFCCDGGPSIAVWRGECR